MKILLITNFVIFPWEGGNSRFTYILDNLDCKNDEVELITSNFRHETKTHRVIPEDELKKYYYKITLLNESGYKKNISLKRFYSHFIFSRNLKRYLNEQKRKFDIIYCAIPSLSVGKVVAKYAKKNNIKFIIDVQDLWPEAFKMVFNIPLISNVIFYPMKKEANYIYSKADEIIAVSQTYCDRVLKVNKKVSSGLSVFLGTDLKYFDKCKEKNKKNFNDKIIRIAYVGTLGYSYDIISIMKAIKILNNKGITSIKFIVIGDGPLRNTFEIYAKENNINCEFTGRLEYEKMIGILCACDMAVNPIKKGSAGSIINKVGDYAMAGLAVVNTQECREYKELLEYYNAGLNAINGDIIDISKKIEKLVVDENMRKNMGANNRKMAVEKFDRKKTYKEICKRIKGQKI